MEKLKDFSLFEETKNIWTIEDCCFWNIWHLRVNSGDFLKLFFIRARTVMSFCYVFEFMILRFQIFGVEIVPAKGRHKIENDNSPSASTLSKV